jgi:hypothetical protein
LTYGSQVEYVRIVTKVQNISDSIPRQSDVPRLALEASRRAEAMGLLEHRAARADVRAIRQLANRVRRAGIGASAADLLDNVETPSAGELAELLTTMIAALEASPVPVFEWHGVARVLGGEELAPLLNVSVSSLKRYQSGERDTPDAIAARLHWLALTVGDLAGSYNDIGIRRWFHRKRERLNGRAPAALLRGDWDPDDDGPAQVRQLARELVSLSAT